MTHHHTVTLLEGSHTGTRNEFNAGFTVKPTQIKSGWGSSHAEGVWRSVAGRTVQCNGSGCKDCASPVVVERSYPIIAVEKGYVKYRFSGDFATHLANCASDERPKSHIIPELKTIIKSFLGEGIPPYVTLCCR